MADPVLTPAEAKVADSLAQGWSCIRVAQSLNIKKKTVYVHVMNIAWKLPNPDDLKPYQLVSRWAFQRKGNGTA